MRQDAVQKSAIGRSWPGAPGQAQSYRAFFVCLILIFNACRGGGTDPFSANVIGGVTGSDEITAGLDCPNPGALPFELEETTFLNSERVAELKAELVEPDPGPNHVFEDFLGNPGDPQTLRGIATYGVNVAILHPLREEFVSFWAPTAAGEWVYLGRTQTNDDGEFSLELSQEQSFPAGQWPVYMVVEGDGSCAKAGVFVYPKGTQVIVSDIDETMTTADEEVATEIADPDYVGAMRPAANAMMQTYAQKGYKIIFVTARPFHLRLISRQWLDVKEFPLAKMETASTFVVGADARAYKREALQFYTNQLGLKVVRAYGNADSDFQAYTDAGIPADRAFSIGELSGFAGTTGILGEGYEDHMISHVEPFPQATQPE